MKKYIGEISYKTLSSTLKELERDQLIHRGEYPQIPPKVEYSLTERGKSLIPILVECASGAITSDLIFVCIKQELTRQAGICCFL